MKRIAIVLSGRGSNMAAIAEACASQRWPARIVSVVGNVPFAEGLARAEALGLPVRVVDHRAEPDRERYDEALVRTLDAEAPDLVVLAGFMRILTGRFVRHYEGRLLNVHPSLLPAFPGLHTHRRALEAGVQVHGATVHFVTDDLDCGPIVAQAAVRVREDDTEDALRARVLRAEHRLYPMAVRWFVEDRLRIRGSRVQVCSEGLAERGEARLLWGEE
jgi:phosphoribosylglycinamide formyltransferase-1